MNSKNVVICPDRLCNYKNVIIMPIWQFKLIDIVVCQQCGQDIDVKKGEIRNG